jgi:hypothetical protein
MITALLQIIAVALIIWLLFWFIDWIPVPQPFNKVIKVILMAFGILVLVNAILIAFGQPGFVDIRWR